MIFGCIFPKPTVCNNDWTPLLSDLQKSFNYDKILEIFYIEKRFITKKDYEKLKI